MSAVAAYVTLSIAVAGLCAPVERLVGWPLPLYRVIGHPVEWVGRLIAHLDARLNRDTDGPAVRRAMGVATLALVLLVTGGAAVATTLALRAVPWGWVVEALIAVPLLSQRDLARHVRAVERGLAESLEAGRAAVSQIVGRDPQALDESGVARGAIESLAENTSDGIVAPLFWLALFGLPGAVLYKTVNTADSMIGHRSERHLQFGWAAARLDDVANLVPARLTAGLFALAALFSGAAVAANAWRSARRDARHHVSPNAGWPEAAMAGALGIRLGGPRAYGGRELDLATMGDGRPALSGSDIARALVLYGRSLDVLLVPCLAALYFCAPL